MSKKNSWGLGGCKKSRWGVRIVQTNKALTNYCQAVRIQAAFQMRRLGLAKILKPEGVALRVRVFFAAQQHAMDVHNAVETVLDALQGVCYDDDVQVVGLWTPPIRLVDKAKPRIEIEIQTAEAARHDPRWAYSS